MDQHQVRDPDTLRVSDLKVALPPYDVNSQQQCPERYSQDNGQQSPQAYHQGYNQPPGYQSVPQNYGQHLQPAVIALPGPPVRLQERPPDYLVPAIFACLCCFCPTGICAIIAATNANQAADVGDLTYAKQQNKIARTLLIVTIILGIVCIAVSVVLRMGA